MLLRVRLGLPVDTGAPLRLLCRHLRLHLIVIICERVAQSCQMGTTRLAKRWEAGAVKIDTCELGPPSLLRPRARICSVRVVTVGSATLAVTHYRAPLALGRMACGTPGTRPTFITPVSLPSATVAFSVVDSIVAGLIGVTQGIARAKSRRGWVKLTGNRTACDGSSFSVRW